MNFATYYESNKLTTFYKWDQLLAADQYLNTAVNLCKDISSKFPNSTSLLVGGCVRDMLLDKKAKDIDIATNVPVLELENFYHTHNIGASKTFGILTVKFGEFVYEVANFRKDGAYTDNRRPDSVEMLDTFEGDSARRDLTINSFGLTADGQIIDYQNGLQDLKNKLVKTVGAPKDRFTEDAVRILRTARFAASLGFEIEPNTRQAMIELKHLLNNISKERIAGELYKAAKSGPSLAKFIQHLDDTGILQDILPEVAAYKGYMHNPVHHPEGGATVIGHIYAALNASISNDPVVNIAILLHDCGKPSTFKNREGKLTYYGHEDAGVPIVHQIGERLKLSNDDIAAIEFATSQHMNVHKIGELSIKKITQLVNNVNWNVLKEVSYADEAARGYEKFDPSQFVMKIQIAEQRVKNLSQGKMGNDALKDTFKKYIDGNKLLIWIPDLVKTENRPFIGKILSSVQDWVMNELSEFREPTEEQVKEKCFIFFNLLKPTKV